MPTTATAVDEMMARVKAMVDGSSISPKPILLWDDVQQPRPTSSGASWVRTLVRHVDNPQTSLSDGGGKKTWTAKGILSAEINTPCTPPTDGRTLVDQIGPIIRDGFRGYASPGGCGFGTPGSRNWATEGPGTW